MLVAYGIVEERDIALWVAVLGSILIPQLAMQNTSKKPPEHRKDRKDT